MIKTIEVTISLNVNVEEDDDDMAMAVTAIKNKIKDFDFHKDMVMINFIKPDSSNGILTKLSRLDYLEQTSKVITGLLSSDKTYVDVNDIELILKNKKGK